MLEELEWLLSIGCLICILGNFFGELHVKWSVGTKISGVGAEAALKNRSAQDLFGERLVGRKSRFASGRLLGRECRKLFARGWGGSSR